jgi:hypothetical protein
MCKHQVSLLKHNNVRACPSVTAADRRSYSLRAVIQEMNMLTSVLAICLLQFAHTLVVEPKAEGDKSSELNGNFSILA